MKYVDSLGIQILGSGFNFSQRIEGIQPSTLLMDTLLSLWSDLKKETEIAVILLDDVQNFASISHIFTLLKNILGDEEIVRTKFLFILSCTPNGWQQFLQKHHPIGRYFTPRLELERLSKEEVNIALERILKDTGVIFDKNIKERIWKYTQGHPYELQILCSNLYENQISGKVTEQIWNVSLSNDLKALGERVFDGLYSKASKQEKMVLYLIALLKGPVERKDILSLSKKYNLNLSENIVGSALYRLTSKGLLKKQGNFEYLPPDRFFKEYVLQVKGYNGRGDNLVQHYKHCKNH